MAEKRYLKLPGRGSKTGHLLTWCTLWLGPDHLLQVESSGYTEEYKRFFYKDIQSLALCRTSRARNWSVFFLAMLGLGAVFALLSSSEVARALWGIWITFFAICLMLNLLLGASASCTVSTAVQQEQLPSIKRLRKGRKVVTALRERVAAAQGLLTAAELLSRLNGLEPTAAGAAPSSTEPTLGT
jgi:hypothetical protein